MSYYIDNPLDNFRSYSYHHILVVGNNSEGIRQLTENGNSGFLSKVSGAQLGEDIGNNVFLLVDTRKTSDFQIESLNYEAYVTAGKVTKTPTDNIIIGSLVTMRLIDPSGIGFFNYMHYLIHEKLMTDVTGLQFLLHTAFVGHDDDGNTRYMPEHSISIPLIMAGEFNLAEFGVKGGLYDISFACANNGSAHLLTNVSFLPEVIDIKAKDNLLGNAIQSLENQLNLKSKEFYLHYNPQFKNSDGTISGDTSQGTVKNENAHNGRLVQYMITIPESWFYYWVDVHQVNSEEIDWVKKKKETPEAQASSTAEEKEPTPEQTSYDALLSTAQGMSIADVLGMIFKNTDKVNKMFNMDTKKEGTGKCYKILTSITSNTETVMVHYDVAEFDLPDVNQLAKIKDASKDANNLPKRDNGITPENAIEYDYLFSGKNSHILDMDIKANNLFVALMSSTSGGAAACQRIQEENQKHKSDVSPSELKVDLNECLPMQPLCRPSITSSQAVNLAPNVNKQLPQTKKRAENVQHFHRALADLNAATIQPNVKIRGNPKLLTRYTIESIPPHISYYGKVQDFLNASDKEDTYNDKETNWEYDPKSQKKVTGSNAVTKAHVDHRAFIEKNHLQKVKKDIAETSAAADNKSYLAGGTWVKINIFAPRDYPFNRGATSSDDNVNSYKQQFFYDSWYLLAKITNTFSGGSFTQELQLLSYDLYGKYGIKKRSGAETPQ